MTRYRITDSDSSEILSYTAVTFHGPQKKLVEKILLIQSLHWDAEQFGHHSIQSFPNLEEILFPRQVCDLLGKYYGLQISEASSTDTDINLYDVWNWKRKFFTSEEIHTPSADCLLNPELIARIQYEHYRPGLAAEVHHLTLHGFGSDGGPLERQPAKTKPFQTCSHNDRLSLSQSSGY